MQNRVNQRQYRNMSWAAHQRRATSLILSTFDKHCQLSPLCENDSTRLLSDFTRLVQGPTQKVLSFFNRALSHWWKSLSYKFLQELGHPIFVCTYLKSTICQADAVLGNLEVQR